MVENSKERGGCSENQTSINTSILLVDADTNLSNALKSYLSGIGYDVKISSSATQALKIINSAAIDIIISELKLPDLDGFTLVERGRKLNPGIIAILTAQVSNDEIVLQAIRSGANDFIPKPINQKELLLLLKKLEAKEETKSEPQKSKPSGKKRPNFSSIIAQNKEMLAIFETIKRLSNFKTTVLISGESGTGKELIARAIHYNSERRSQPFVAINCGAIPENLIESELFGHKKGAFTDALRDKPGLFQEAEGGTVFLDEIGELPLQLQVKLLRVLQENCIRPVGAEELLPIDVRIIAATHRDLEDDVMTGRFREDLFYRLNVVSLRLPALRERKDDLPVLIQSLIEKHNKRLGLEVKGVTPDTLELLRGYNWPGNVRELENCIERAMVLSEGENLSVEALPPHIAKAESPLPRVEEEPADGDENLSIKDRVRRIETTLIQRALAKTKGNRTHAAKLLEISHRTLLYKLKEYGIG